MTTKIGQRHYVVARLDDARPKYWRSRGNQHQRPEWTWDLSRATKYRTPGDARRCAAQLEVDAPLAVQMLLMIIDMDMFRIGAVGDG